MRLLVLLFLLLPAGTVRALSDEEIERVGKMIWQNECNGTLDGLTTWNSGESFASIGIGHFIWYPKGIEGPYEESFPKLVQYLQNSRVKLPAWLKPGLDCPWDSRAEFQRDFRSQQMNELRALMAATVRHQSRFLAFRLHAAFPKMLTAADRRMRARVRHNVPRLSTSAAGTFAMIDYVNFKGEGIRPTERYQGEGWGLMQVLANMKTDGDPLRAFADSATDILERRVANSPPERNEARWLPGWKARMRRYVE